MALREAAQSPARMVKLKLPPYARALLERRRAGEHPLEVALIYGHNWREDVGSVPLLALKPEDYEPGKYDFHVVAGVRVVLHDQDLGADERNTDLVPPTFGKFYDLVAELAAFAALVSIEWPAQCGWPASEARGLAFGCRWFDPEAKCRQWPRWWSDELDRHYIPRWDGWFRDSAAVTLEREHAEP